jgi:hypothetical protein
VAGCVLRRLTSAAWMLVALVPTSGLARNPEQARATLELLNKTWIGADCVIRIPVQIRKKRDRDGWSESAWFIKQTAGGKEDHFAFRFRVSDRDRIQNLMDGDTLRPGTRFVAEGWGFRWPDRTKGLYLQLRFRDVPVEARWLFTTKSMSTKSKVSASQLRNIERYMRLQAFQVHSAEDLLVEVPAAPVRATPVPAVSDVEPPPPAPEVFKPELRLLVAAVQPARATSGELVQLLLTYEIGGLPAGALFEVTETRRLMSGETQVASFANRVARGSGSFTSELPVRLPANLSPGLYSLEAEVELAGVTASGSAFFLVNRQDSGGSP